MSEGGSCLRVRYPLTLNLSEWIEHDSSGFSGWKGLSIKDLRSHTNGNDSFPLHKSITKVQSYG